MSVGVGVGVGVEDDCGTHPADGNMGIGKGVGASYVMVSVMSNSPPLKSPSALAVHICPRLTKGTFDVKEDAPVNVIVVVVTSTWTIPLLQFNQLESI